MNSKDISVVVFDLDNTLVDTLGVIVESFNRVMTPILGRSMTQPEVVSYFGPTEDVVLQRLSPPGRIEDIIQQFRDAYDAGMVGLTPYPGIEGILKRLKASGKSLGLCTGKGRWTTESTLKRTGLAEYFTDVMTGDDVQRNKPHPDPLLEIARRRGCRPDQLIMVGDALADVRSANAAGAHSILVLWGHSDTRPGNDEQARIEARCLFDRIEDFDHWCREERLYSTP